MSPEDAERLARLWTSAQAEASAFVRTLVRDSDDVQDLVQQVAVKVARNFDQYDPARSFVAWTIGIAKHEVLAWRRNCVTDRLVFSDAMVDRIAEVFEEQRDDERLRRRALADCMQVALDDRGRQAIQLYYVGGLKSPEIGDRLSASPGAVRKLLARSREALRRCIESRLADEGAS